MNNFRFKNQHVLFFVGGAVFTAITANFAKSKCCKKLCVGTLAKGMKMKNDLEHSIAVIKEEAEDLYNEAKVSNEEQDLSSSDQAEE